MSRPVKYKIDPKEVEKLASYGLTVKDVADFVGCPDNLISKSYSEFYTKGRNEMKKALRMKQIQLALRGDRVMLIWLGKQYLDQAEKIATDVTSGGKAFEFIIGSANNGKNTNPDS